MKTSKIKFNGKNYNGFVYINDEKKALTEDVKTIIIDHFIQEIESILNETETDSKIWEQVTDDMIQKIRIKLDSFPVTDLVVTDEKRKVTPYAMSAFLRKHVQSKVA